MQSVKRVTQLKNNLNVLIARNLITHCNKLPPASRRPSEVPIVTKLFNQFRHEYFCTKPTIDHVTYERVCDETLDSLTEYIEELIESSQNFKSADVAYSDGVLTVNCGGTHGTYVINRQTPNRQIWLSSPSSGPKRYDFDTTNNCWIYKHDGRTLHQLLQEEFANITNDKVDFSKCSYS
ncbi:hypothetical protein PPYR_15178 [Photinus pyralis]|uniref:ferroxidase n=1 Tax=Photinus pyralis TaxID=7054 RepID=A0A5N4A0I2_PHOPY|nr:frataxin homolog, mitochondrial [Photinus pyralis]KAB0790823.1 hypothetical protein PPYR_15178 [Photinus pyralis]